MTAVEMKFPAGRFHATPWGRHANEGPVEWPPAPWRILRALVATWFLKARDDVAEADVRALVDALAKAPPNFWLPRASLGHTRHYMPYFEGSKAKTTKVFDAFIHLAPPDYALQVHWPVELSTPLQAALSKLLESLGYLGRAESLVEARLLSPGEVLPANATPLPSETPVPPEHDLVRLLTPLPPPDLSAWLAAQSSDAEPASKKSKGRKTTRLGALTLPVTVFETLLADTPALQTSGWTLPPGTKLIDYTRAADAFELAPVPRSRVNVRLPTVARYALAGRVLPRITQALSLGERVHQTLVKHSSNHRVFTGFDENGGPASRHQHAYIFSEPGENADTIGFVTVTAAQGFDAQAQSALRRLHRVWGHGGHDVHLVLIGLGTLEDFPGSCLFGESQVWRSLTPFVSTLHPKVRRNGRPKLDSDGWQIGSPPHDICRLLKAENRPVPGKIIESRSGIIVGGRTLRCIQFQSTRRHGGGRRAAGFGCALELTFSESFRGPLALGYGAHFGLGLFVPVGAAPQRDFKSQI